MFKKEILERKMFKIKLFISFIYLLIASALTAYSQRKLPFKVPGKPLSLWLVEDQSCNTSNGCDLAYISVKVIDEFGHLFQQGSHKIQKMVEGKGGLQGCGSGYQTD